MDACYVENNYILQELDVLSLTPCVELLRRLLLLMKVMVLTISSSRKLRRVINFMLHRHAETTMSPRHFDGQSMTTKLNPGVRFVCGDEEDAYDAGTWQQLNP